MTRPRLERLQRMQRRNGFTHGGRQLGRVPALPNPFRDRSPIPEPLPAAPSETIIATIERIVYVEDSDDEVFLARIVFGRQRIVPELVHYARFSDLERDLTDGTLSDLDRALVVLDLNLKLTKGTDAVSRLRELPTARDAVIGVCTGSEDPADRRDTEAAGGDFFVGKPLDVACLERICTLVPALRFERSADGSCGLSLDVPSV